jgi:cell division protein FtsL
MTPPAAAAAPAVAPRRPVSPGRRTAPARPRRISGPLPSRPAARPRTPSRSDGGIALGLLGLLDGLARHRLLDRLIRGRISIALVAFALIGIVTLQLGLLKLNSSIGHTLQRESLLQRENAALSIENSELAAGERVEAHATQSGMALVPVGAVRFLTARPRLDAGRGAAALKAPVTTASGESSEASTPGHEATTSAGATTAGGEQTTSQSSSSSESSSTPAGQSSHASGESASAPESSSAPPSGASPTPSPAPTTAGSTEATGAGSPEATPAGGTQAGPTG